MDHFERVCRDIKEVKVQGAAQVARAAVMALKVRHDKKSVRILEGLRPTEPMVRNAIKYALAFGIDDALTAMDHNEIQIGKIGTKIVRQGDVLFTHCHSSTVVDILRRSWEEGKHFNVHNTETRPLFQGRKTSQELARLGIPNKHWVDSAMRLALKESDVALLGADAITQQKVYNKIGSELVAETAQRLQVPLYICSSTWKFDVRSVYLKEETPIEQRSGAEVWDSPPGHVHVMNPAFEQVDPKLVHAVVCEFGIVSFRRFVRLVKRKNKWMFD